MPRAEPIKSDSFQAAYDQAVKLLAVRMHTVGELQAKLLRRFSRDTVRPVLKELEGNDFLNDTRYAQIYVENLKRYKDFGYYGIKVKLQQRKVPTEIALDAMHEFFSPEDELVVARRVVKKLKKLKRERYEQVARSLSSKGFHGDIISQVLREGFS